MLAITSFFPIPADRGDPVRVGMFLRALNGVADLTVYAVRRPETGDRQLNEMQEMLPGANLVSFGAPRVGRSIPATATRWAKALLTRTPPWILNRSSADLSLHVQRTVSSYDAVVLLGEAAGGYALRIRTGHVHLDKANVLSCSTRQDVLQANAFWARARLRGVSWLSRRYERRVLRAVDSVSVTSREEAARLRAEYGRVADAVIPSVVELNSRKWLPSVRGAYVVWLGSLEYRSNTAGLQRYLDDGLEILRDAGLTLLVVGSGAHASLVRRLRATPGIEYRGYVADLSAIAADARAAVVPLWSGAGIKLKTLTLMSLGIPVAATAIAMEGIDGRAAIAVSDDPATLSAAIVCASEVSLVATRNAALDVLRRDFSTDAFYRSVANVISAIPSQRTSRATVGKQ